ncbi:thioredoxin family protein [Caldimonas tepidiphila]|uniref:thioredoxin family protein n=1 Tax=Caldimonas tepidiphila TaxID=2315841 RepID=UPI000E5C03CA|nr:thioredoxin family protein [Caldimonas tepidiphila]
MSSPNPAPLPDAPSWLVACLCAQWCGTCRDYRAVFAQAEREFPQARFRWIDIEDEADLVGPVDVEDFPTLLVARGSEVAFFGPLLPHAATLLRLLQARLDESAPPQLRGGEVGGLALRLRNGA